MILPFDNFEINLENMSACYDFNPNWSFKLIKMDKDKRNRGVECPKTFDDIFDLSSLDDDRY